jgi:ABC-2 type transport system ATP-binding protein
MVRDGRLIAVERVSDLLGRATRRVTVRFDDGTGPEELRRLDGVVDLEVVDGGATFRVAGDLDRVVKVLATHRVVDLEVSRPTLEEVFLSYYGEGEG